MQALPGKNPQQFPKSILVNLTYLIIGFIIYIKIFINEIHDFYCFLKKNMDCFRKNHIINSTLSYYHKDFKQDINRCEKETALFNAGSGVPHPHLTDSFCTARGRRVDI